MRLRAATLACILVGAFAAAPDSRARRRCESREFFVSPEGGAQADGTPAHPWSLATALSHPDPVQPGDTLWLRGGVYGDGSGATIFQSALKGTANHPIVVRAWPGERAIVNGGLIVFGEHTWYWGFEISSTVTDRFPSNGVARNPNSIDVYGPGVKLINLVVHDTREGPGLWSEAPDAEAYGCIVYHNGYMGTDRGHGHGIYVQNRDGRTRISDNVIFNQFAAGIHGYGTVAAAVQNITVEGNVVFNNGVLAGPKGAVDNIIFAGDAGMTGIEVRNNFVYHNPDVGLGYSRLGWEWSPRNGGLVASGNYWIGGFIVVMVKNWDSVELSGNTVYTQDGFQVQLEALEDQSLKSYVWDGNRYFGRNRFLALGRESEWENWRKITGLDSASVFSPDRPDRPWVFVRPNAYELRRAHVVVFNWRRSAEVDVDLSAVLTTGDEFEIRDVQDLFAGPLLTGVFHGGTVRLPMSGRGVSMPVGETPARPVSTLPDFGVFLVQGKTDHTL